MAIHDALLQAYLPFREKQLSSAFQKQLTAFASRLNRTVPHRPTGEPVKYSSPAKIPSSFPVPAPWRIPRSEVFFIKHAPYTIGVPNPEYGIRTSGTGHGAYYNIEAFADASKGRLSVGVAAGNIRNADWSGQSFYNELPDRWLLGDAINTSASIIQIADVPQGLEPPTKLYADVQFGWDPMYPNTFGSSYIYNAIENTPGLPDSPLNGFVGVSASVEMILSLISGQNILAQSSTAAVLLNVGVNAEFYGMVQDKPDGSYLFFDFAFSANPWAPIDLLASVPFVQGGQQIAIETTVLLSGIRGGIASPEAGFVTAAFMDLYDGATPVSDVPFSPNPFIVEGITAFTAPF